MSGIKKLTSVNLHTTGEGQRLSYTYSIIDSETRNITKDNIKRSIVVFNDSEKDKEIIEHIAAINSYVTNNMNLQTDYE